MIGKVFTFFSKILNESLETSLVIHFPKAEGSGDSVTFEQVGLTLLLINLEQDEATRNANPYLTVKDDKYYNVMPEIRLNLYMLVVANWSEDYVSGLNALSKVISFFQKHKVFRPGDEFPGEVAFPEEVEKLTVELITLPFNQQNEVWNALRTHYRPSALFKVRMIVFKQEIEQDKPVPKIEKGSIERRIAPQTGDDYNFYFLAKDKIDEIKVDVLYPARKDALIEQISQGAFQDKLLRITVRDYLDETEYEEVRNRRSHVLREFIEEINKEQTIQKPIEIVFDSKPGKPGRSEMPILLEWVDNNE